MCERFSNSSYYWQKNNDYEKAKERLITGIKWWIPHFCNQHGVTTSSFSKWKQAVTSAIDKKIMQLSIKLTMENHKSKWWLKDIIITKVLKLFHNKFIVFLIDKGSGNAALSAKGIGCEYFYIITSTYFDAIKPVEKLLSDFT